MLSQSLTASDLTALIVGFERTVFDLVAESGGRVVKTIGDEVMFTFDDASAAADFALRITSAGDDALPAVRVGLGWGPVLVRQGDCFGPTVNLASRVVGTANGGEVVVDAAMAELLTTSGYTLVPIDERELKGFGAVSLWRLAGSSADAS
jgi:adenylate cyclase